MEFLGKLKTSDKPGPSNTMNLSYLPIIQVASLSEDPANNDKANKDIAPEDVALQRFH